MSYKNSVQKTQAGWGLVSKLGLRFQLSSQYWLAGMQIRRFQTISKRSDTLSFY